VEYATEVLDHLDRDEVVLICQNPEQVAALPLMRPWPLLGFAGTPVRTILELVDPSVVRLLTLADVQDLTDCSVLTSCPSLESLSLRDCRSATNLAALAELPLADLYLGGIAGLSGLPALRRLTRLDIDQELPGDSLAEFLPVESPVEELYLSRHVLRGAAHLRGLRDLTALRRLSLGAPSRLTAESWAEVAALPALTDLTLQSPTPAYSFDLMPELPGIRFLRLSLPRTKDDVRTLAARLPNVRRVVFRCPTWHIPDSEYAELFPAAEIVYDPR
jgi:hypothetical protein